MRTGKRNPQSREAEEPLSNRAFAGLVFKTARSRERELAIEMRREIYARDWPHISDDLVVDALDGHACHLIALTEDRGCLVAAARLVPPHCRPFDVEAYVRLDSITPRPSTTAEIGRLCVRHEWRAIRLPFINLGLLKLALAAARRFGITDFVLTALPNLRNLYRLGYFEPAGLSFIHPTWGPVHVMRLDLLAVQERLAASSEPTARLLLEPPGSRFRL